jgi:16S rRNA (adenine1518-N6/adenine1519-N6)-dimethyltransferase
MKTPPLRTKKSLGQHFLTSTGALSAIITTSDVGRNDIVLEIGPGKGVLTGELLKRTGKVLAIEKDRELIPFLTEKFEDGIKTGKLELIEQDILDFDPDTLRVYSHSYKVVANIPYNITGEILRKFLTAMHKPESMTLLVQKEVAERIVAKDGKESILSLSVKYFGTPSYIQTVKRGSFNPPPKVDSAILYIENIQRNEKINEQVFFTVVRAGFKSKRKKLISNLVSIYDKGALARAFAELSLSENIRAENVSLDQWIALLVLLK